jgi:thiol-disulfide isomerase/thioredoxin
MSIVHLPSRRAALSLALAGAGLGLSPAVASAQAAPAAAPAVDPRPKTHALLGQPAPATDLPRLGGGRFTNADFRGKTTIVEFWGLWCPDCLLDGDNVAALAARVARERNMRFVAVHSRGRFGRWGSVEAYFAEKGHAYPVAFDDDGAAYRAWALKWVPTFLIVDRQGVIRDHATDLGAGNGIGVDGLLAKARAVARRRA